MPAVLRAYGDAFDVDVLLSDIALPVCAVKRRGELVSRSEPNGRRHDRSGIHVTVSDADFNEFPRQVEEAIEFLLANKEQVNRLTSFPGVDRVTLDFGIARRDSLLQCDRLPRELIRLAASCGLDIELSQYPADE